MLLLRLLLVGLSASQVTTAFSSLPRSFFAHTQKPLIARSDANANADAADARSSNVSSDNVPSDASITPPPDDEITKTLSLANKIMSLFLLVHKNVFREKKQSPSKPALLTAWEEITQNKRRQHRWTRSKAVQQLSAWAFEVCDTDQSGNIDKRAFYTGLLLVHLNLAKYAGVAACFPPTWEQINDLFDLADPNDTGHLNQQEFTDAVIVCFARMTSRIVVYYSTILLAVPYLVKFCLSLFVPLLHKHWSRPWMGRAMAVAEWIVKQIATLAFFSVLVPQLFTRIDSRSRRLVNKQRPSQKNRWGRRDND